MRKNENEYGWDRREAARIWDDFRMFDGSQRDFAKASGVPRTTLQHWNER